MLEKQHPSVIYSAEDTVSFLTYKNRWWNIMNVSHKNKGKFQKNSDSYPLSFENSEAVEFLKSFAVWTRTWRDIKQNQRQGCLSRETFLSLIHTTETMVIIASTLLTDGAQYVLTAKFHTDALEFCFSLYRQMSGCNYHVSVQQVLESERKLHIKSLLHLHSSMYGDIPLQVFIKDICSYKNADINLEQFCDIIDELIIDVTPQEREIIMYIGGYCVYKLKLICESCKKYFYSTCCMGIEMDECASSFSKEQTEHSTYLSLINRGGMKTPSANIVFVISGCFSIFKILISSNYEILFVCHENQHMLMVNLTENYLKDSNILDLEENCNQCGTCFYESTRKALQVFSNICLNNYSTRKTDEKAYNNIIKPKCVKGKKGSSNLINNDDRKVKKYK